MNVTVWAVGTDGAVLTDRRETTASVEVVSANRVTFDVDRVMMSVITAGVTDHIEIWADGDQIASIGMAAYEVQPGETIGLGP